MSLKRETIKKIDHDIVDEVVKEELLDRFQSCYQCGTCSGACPSGRRTAMRTRKLIRQGLLGQVDLLSSDLLWLCSTCYTCYERCPRNVPVTDIILKYRNLAAQRGFIRTPHIAVSKNLINTGHGVPLDHDKTPNWMNLRKSLKLAPIPPTVHSFPEALKEVQVIIKEMKFDQLIMRGETFQNGQNPAGQKTQTAEQKPQKGKAEAEKK
ncbi:MAG: CoB--CoM heterodisulfide reductase subunit C [Candidatus Lokiarchaeota archaeon]|nr:CoB--CoM heterodisulfide reductase subunit C [Candidatus Lokiarchaeota archaeon]